MEPTISEVVIILFLEQQYRDIYQEYANCEQMMQET